MLKNLKVELLNLDKDMNQNSASIRRQLPKLEKAIRDLSNVISEEDTIKGIKKDDFDADVNSINLLLEKLSFKTALKLKFISDFPNYINK